ncbi:hypothetical protein CTI12_AA051410 [Artemisia annua]|uniref:Hybrid signal transduction histidine kinase M n=1 Tax=Artemisia annua TaxID=35608 RepID=A0A2U1QBI9_ARTAN|nr:hypothetical protein CTI12_AA051410 [Artemisia annua]
MASDSTSWELPYKVANIKDRIPFVLDLDELNYPAWRVCFKTHCVGYDVLGHIDGTSVPEGPNDKNWEQIDAVVKLWIYNSISEPLLVRILDFKKDVPAKDVWKNIEDHFCTVNKHARAMHLVSDLQNMKIGDLSIEVYTTKIRRLANFLAFLDAPVSDQNLVMYLINSLGDKYKQVATIIRHREPLPTFDEACSMLSLEESRLSCEHQEWNQQDTNGNHLNNMENNPHPFLWDESQPSQPNYSDQELTYQLGRIDVWYDPY